MRLTLHTDYALRTLIYLGTHTDRLVSIREVVATYGVSENHLVKIIHRLGIGGFIETLRGRNGGLRLARPASEIRIGDVVRFTEENMALVPCTQEARSPSDGPVCILGKNCRLRGFLAEALGDFMSVLDRYSLQDLIN